MCGIAGLVLQKPGSYGTYVDQFNRELAHRGPDDHGWLIYASSLLAIGRGSVPDQEFQAALLHRRLSILDLSEAGWQPMSSKDKRFWLIFNGEIYNFVELKQELQNLGHHFSSHSDTEVLLAAWVQWGTACLPRLKGMFAFALLDTAEQRLFLVRDFFGIKPIYYVRWREGIAFASEIPPLLELPGVSRGANPGRLYQYLRFGTTDYDEQTLFSDVLQLPPAHYLEIPLSAVSLHAPKRYWKMKLDQTLELSFAEVTCRVREAFIENVRLHLRSDVPVGTALSGGIDSSAIVAAMRQLEPHMELQAFSFIADEQGLSEEHWVDAAAQAGRARVHKIRSGSDELVSDLDTLIRAQGEPFGSTSIYAQYRVFQRAKAEGIIVMLDGQGADEMLGGYAIYSAARLASLIKQGRLVQALNFLRKVSVLPGRQATWARAALFLLPTALQGFARRLVGQDLIPSWLNKKWFDERGVELQSLRIPKQGSVLRDELLQTLEQTSLPMLLRYEDRNSMIHSIESRVPFLTPDFAQLLLSLPEEFVIGADGTTKSVFRAAMRGLVPDTILDRKDKIGFATPEKSWLSSLRPWVDKILNSEVAQQTEVLDIGTAKAEWESILSGQHSMNFRVWRWINLIRWMELFKVELNG